MYCKPAIQTRGSQPPKVDGGGGGWVLSHPHPNKIKIKKNKMKLKKNKKNFKFYKPSINKLLKIFVYLKNNTYICTQVGTTSTN
jgi:hypothetical protein